METFTLKTFDIPKLNGISEKNIEEHLKLYKGYVTNSNLIFNKLAELKNDPEKNSIILAELQRRFGFEFGGMRNHEYYFASLSGGKKEINKDGNLYKKIMEDWGSFERIRKEGILYYLILYKDTPEGKIEDYKIVRNSNKYNL